YHALYHQARAHACETVLVHGASGGVGIAAVQIGRAIGLRVLGTAGTPRGLEIAKREGAHAVFDHRKAGYQDEILQATGNRGSRQGRRPAASERVHAILRWHCRRISTSRTAYLLPRCVSICFEYTQHRAERQEISGSIE